MSFQRIGCVGYGLILSLLSGSFGAYAQIILDGKIGPGPAGPLQGPNYQIPAQYGEQHGGNLFHSFGKFNVSTGESATFSGPDSVQNIIGRVTWGYPSAIDGTLRSTIPNANLFLLNPAGVLFGPNATVDVSGSFHVSTADYLRLGENDRFYADPTKPSVLSTAPVEAFGFLTHTPASVSIKGSHLEVPTEKTLSVIGGNVWTSGTLRAPAGRLNVAAMSGPGEVKPTATALETPAGQPGGAIAVAGGILSATGDRAGSIFIRGGRFSVDGGVVGVNARGLGDGGKLDVRAQDMEVTNNGALQSMSAQGRGADVTVTVDRLTLSNGGFIEVSSGGTGPGGNLHIMANNIEIKGQGQYPRGVTSRARCW